jgi:hypothetical protein
MTVIAVCGRVMAADSQIVVDGSRYSKGAKIRRMPDGSLVGTCGDWVSGVRLLDFMVGLDRAMRHGDLRAFAGVTALHLRCRGCWLLVGGGSGGITRLKGKFFAEGSGSVAALAAMEAGADPGMAVKIACKLDTLCAGPIVIEELG